MISGLNLHEIALDVLGSSGQIMLAAYVSTAPNAAGYDVPTYAAQVEITGGVYAVPRARYQALGLDYAKRYVTLYTSHPVRTIERDSAGDRITWDGRTYVCESATDWRTQYGWRKVLCLEVPA